MMLFWTWSVTVLLLVWVQCPVESGMVMMMMCSCTKLWMPDDARWIRQLWMPDDFKNWVVECSCGCHMMPDGSNSCWSACFPALFARKICQFPFFARKKNLQSGHLSFPLICDVHHALVIVSSMNSSSFAPVCGLDHDHFRHLRPQVWFCPWSKCLQSGHLRFPLICEGHDASDSNMISDSVLRPSMQQHHGPAEVWFFDAEIKLISFSCLKPPFFFHLQHPAALPICELLVSPLLGDKHVPDARCWRRGRTQNAFAVPGFPSLLCSFRIKCELQGGNIAADPACSGSVRLSGESIECNVCFVAVKATSSCPDPCISAEFPFCVEAGLTWSMAASSSSWPNWLVFALLLLALGLIAAPFACHEPTTALLPF